MSEEQQKKDVDRRQFLSNGVAMGAALGLGGAMAAAAPPAKAKKGKTAPAVEPPKPAPPKPNIVLYMSDQFRWDFLGANGLNGSTHTPNLDTLAANGKNFNYAVTNQPVCAPARSVMLTGMYATETGVWHNGLGMTQTLADAGKRTAQSGLQHQPDRQVASCARIPRPQAEASAS